VFTSVRPNSVGGMDLKAENCIVVFDQCDEFFGSAIRADNNQLFPPKIADEVEARRAKQDREWLDLPVGNTRSVMKDTYAAPRIEISFRHKPGEYCTLVSKPVGVQL